MKLREFTVRQYRNILDSSPISVEPDVTCLVGKNEAGKTALLQALERLNPASEVRFDVDEEYPRWILVRDRKAGKIEEARPITAVFALEASDRAAIEEVVGPGVLTHDLVEVSRRYGDAATYWTNVKLDEARAVQHLLDTAEIDPPVRDQLQRDTFAALTSAIAKARAADEAATVEPMLATVEAAVAELIGDGGTLRKCVLRLLHERLPKFFYFSDYSVLPGRVDLRQLTGNEAPGSSGMQTARALLLLAGTDTSRLAQEDYELRKAELEAVSNDLTRQVFEYWTQNRELSVTIDVDKVTEAEPTGQTAVARYLEVRVLDRRHGYTNNFGQRSSGFQWFFSFLAAFSEFEDHETGVVILLDEPALGLHARAQADFLRFINERLAPAGQVIFTTHSPFMVETGHLQRVRVVEDTGPDTGTVVSADVLATDRDTLFPLQAALGYDIAQSLFLAPHSLLVEGTSDFTYLTVLSDHVRDQGRTALDERFTITPTGGAQNIPTFVALLGAHLDITVLIDSGTQGVQRLTDMAKRGLLEPQHVVAVGEVTTAANADIEDLFTASEYLGLYNGATGASLKVADLPNGDRIVKRIAAKIGGDFDHGIPADYLLRHKTDVVGKLSAGTLERFEHLFERLNKTLPK